MPSKLPRNCSNYSRLKANRLYMKRHSMRPCTTMWKRTLPVGLAALLLVGCNATLTNLTPTQQLRNETGLYPVEVSLSTRQSTLRWDSIKPRIKVGTNYYPMTQTPLMTNRWEGLIRVPEDENSVRYRYRFDYKYNDFGGPGRDVTTSQEYTLKIIDE